MESQFGIIVDDEDNDDVDEMTVMFTTVVKMMTKTFNRKLCAKCFLEEFRDQGNERCFKTTLRFKLDFSHFRGAFRLQPQVKWKSTL